MSLNQKIREFLFSGVLNIKWYALFLGFILFVIGWIIALVNYDDVITIKTIFLLHKSNPVIYLIDLIPILIIAAAFAFEKQYQLSKTDFEKQIAERDEKMDQMAQFAKEIGQGNFNAEIEVEGEKNVLAESLLLMRENLSNNYDKESEFSWISSGKELIGDILRTENKINTLSNQIIHKLVGYINVVQGALYIFDEEEKLLKNVATYAYNRKKYINQEFKIGQGLIGECAYELDYIYRTEIPEDYVTITSGILGEKKT